MSYEYRCTMTFPYEPTSKGEAAAIIQTLFNDGCVAGNFTVTNIDRETVAFTITRDWETDTGAGSLHDGDSDGDAIEQLAEEFLEGNQLGWPMQIQSRHTHREWQVAVTVTLPKLIHVSATNADDAHAKAQQYVNQADAETLLALNAADDEPTAKVDGVVEHAVC